MPALTSAKSSLGKEKNFGAKSWTVTADVLVMHSWCRRFSCSSRTFLAWNRLRNKAAHLPQLQLKNTACASLSWDEADLEHGEKQNAVKCQRWWMGQKRELSPNSIGDQGGGTDKKPWTHQCQARRAQQGQPLRDSCSFPLQFIHHPSKMPPQRFLPRLWSDQRSQIG